MDPERTEPDPVRASLEQALGAQYRILRLLGRGGMGAVYLAREEALERLVAIKVLRPELGPAAEGRERFRREARTAAQLTHPSVVPLLAFGETEGLLYLVMGYVRGEPLSARLRRDGRVGPEEVRRVVADVAEALDYAHRRGVVHRDVKPDNILLEDETGRAVLTDFGIAKAWGSGLSMTGTGAVVGTPQYMSPEQASGQATIDGRSDIYALGLVAYAMLAGRPPFEGGTTQDVLLRRLTQEARPLRAAADGVPNDLAEAVSRCLRRDPAARWPDARSLREAVSPTGLEGDQLPEPLDTLDGVMPLAIPLAAIAAITAVSLLGTDRVTKLPVVLLLAIGALFLVDAPILFSAVRAARSRGFGWAQIVGAACRQPTWWRVFWYPRRFRRPGDLWDRLPLPFRAWRIVLTLMAVDLVGLAMAIAFFSGPGKGDDRWLARLESLGLSQAVVSRAVAGLLLVQGASFLLLALALGVVAIFGARLMRTRGFDTYTLRRLCRTLDAAPTADRAAWSDPRLAAILLPPKASVGPVPTTPRELARAVAELAAGTGASPRPIAAEAATAARALLALVEERDADVARLSAAADPSEPGRLRDRLSALETAGDAEAVQMRDLLAQHLALAERMGGRLETARAERERAADLLRALWRALADVHPDDEQAARRVRALCAEAGALASGTPLTDEATVTRTA